MLYTERAWLSSVSTKYIYIHKVTILINLRVWSTHISLKLYRDTWYRNITSISFLALAFSFQLSEIFPIFLIEFFSSNRSLAKRLHLLHLPWTRLIFCLKSSAFTYSAFCFDHSAESLNWQGSNSFCLNVLPNVSHGFSLFPNIIITFCWSWSIGEVQIFGCFSLYSRRTSSRYILPFSNTRCFFFIF